MFPARGALLLAPRSPDDGAWTSVRAPSSCVRDGLGRADLNGSALAPPSP